MNWPEEDWPSCLVNLLSGEALTIFLSLDSSESRDYKKVRETPPLCFNCTESGCRTKFMEARPSNHKNFDTF